MRNPSQALLLAVLMASLILPPGLPVAGAAASNPVVRVRSVLLVGDSLSIGLGKQLEAVFSGHPGLTFAHLGKVSSGLANPAFFDWDANLSTQVKAHHPDVVLIMLGANDNKNLPTPDGRSAAFGSKEWDGLYTARLTRLHGVARSENPKAAVYFIGVPIMGDPAFNAEMNHVNGVLAQAAKILPGSAFIDVKDVLADPSGAFAPMARAADGGLVKLRAADGVHISGAGSRLLAARCLDAISVPSGLPKTEMLASLADRDLQPITAAAAGQPPVQLAEVRRVETPAAPAAKPAAPAGNVTTVAPAPVAAPAAGGYAVADGDTLWSVAKRLGVSPDALAAANPGVDPRRLSIGQSLAVPAGATLSTPVQAQAPTRPAGQPAATGRLHAVAEGDNFWSVARRYDVTVAALTQANPGVEPTRLRIGQQLAIPVGGPAPVQVAAKGGYTVADGDNFWSIAHRLGVDVAELKRVNATVDPQKLQPGQVLVLPGGAATEGGQAQAPTRQEAPSQRTVSDAGLYPVAKGDTLWSLSRRFGVSLDTLLSVNTEIEPAKLQVGQLVTIPAGEPVASANALVFPVAVGDTLWSIARRFDVSVEALLAANPGVDPLKLREGQTLRVPSSLAAVAASGAPKTEPAPAPQTSASPAAEAPATAPAAIEGAARLHTVSGGDTLWHLARRYGVDVERILAVNAGIDPVRLRVGQTVLLPGGVVSMAAR
jgi:LysM repeat protein/lysophospholipase L1-like esterase